MVINISLWSPWVANLSYFQNKTFSGCCGFVVSWIWVYTLKLTVGQDLLSASLTEMLAYQRLLTLGAFPAFYLFFFSSLCVHWLEFHFIYKHFFSFLYAARTELFQISYKSSWSCGEIGRLCRQVTGGGKALCVLVRFNLLPRQSYVEILIVLPPVNYLDTVYRLILPYINLQSFHFHFHCL